MKPELFLIWFFDGNKGFSSQLNFISTYWIADLTALASNTSDHLVG
jgi:hypothetical protein